MLNYLILVLWGIKTLKNILFNSYLWQLKEYRLDRFFDYLKTVEARRLYLSKNVLIKLSFLAGSLLVVLSNFLYRLFPFAVAVFFAREIYLYFLEVKKRGLLRPKFTKKAGLIVAVSLVLMMLLALSFIYLAVESVVIFSLMLILSDLFLPFLIALVVLLVNPAANRQKKQLIDQAAKKIKNNPNLIVIGVTGSYGKSSVKEYLAQLLADKFSVLKTPANVNTEIGVANLILKELKPEHQIFIVEMGAYQPGEIREICDLVKPQIGILTAINQQHLSLFGSVDNIIKTKFELIDSLPANGLAVLNGDNDYIVKQSAGYQINKVFYSVLEEADIFAGEIGVDPDKINFKLSYDKKKTDLTAALAGGHNVSNLLAVITVGLYLKMNIEDIRNKLKTIKPIDRTLTRLAGFNNSVLIDDSYNANPSGVLAALEYLKVYQGQEKIIVMTAMAELGSVAGRLHQLVGQQLGQIGDQVYLINPNFSEILKNEAVKNGLDPSKILIEEDPEKVSQQLKRQLNERTVVLFEGRGTEKVLEKLKI